LPGEITREKLEDPWRKGRLAVFIDQIASTGLYDDI